MTRLVAVVGDRGRLRDIVTYALREGRDAAQYRPVTVEFLVPLGAGNDSLRAAAGEALAARVEEIVASERLASLDVTVSVAPISGEDPATRVAALVDALPRDTSRVVLMPSATEFSLAPVRETLDTRQRDRVVTVERAPVGRTVSRIPVALPRTSRRILATFGLSLGFYLTLGDPTKPFDLATGVISAGVVTAILSRVALERDPSFATVGRILRATVFLPYLLYLVVRANLAIATVVLDPRLPIEPQFVRVPAPRDRIARALLANSITLTPGTVTVDVVDDELVVHALTEGSRRDLEAGTMASAIAFVVGGDARVSGTDPGEGRQ